MTRHESEGHDKNRVALVSAVVTILLAALKLAAGLVTGSLGLLSEAAHSGLDTFASILTAISIRVAARPADREHPYGHGRFENLSATIQAVLLFGTAGAIIFASLRRLMGNASEVKPSIWAFVVMGLSIAVDVWRSRMLSRAARKYGSPALEADALNFKTDLLSSAVVILGLAATRYAQLTGARGFLLQADAVAALIVALLIIRMSVRLALQGVNVLTDRASGDLGALMTGAAAGVPGVVAARPVRMRESGNRVFADVVVTTVRTLSFSQAHEITEQIESAITAVEPRAEVLVHIEPTAGATETTAEAIRAVALRLGVATHHEQVYEVADGLEAALHIEVEPELTIREAHDRAEQLANILIADVPRLRRVDTHIEAGDPDPTWRREITDARPDVVRRIHELIAEAGHTEGVAEVRLYGSDEPALDAVLSCIFPAELTVGAVHRRTEQLEQLLREAFPALGRVMIHAKPATRASSADAIDITQSASEAP